MLAGGSGVAGGSSGDNGGSSGGDGLSQMLGKAGSGGGKSGRGKGGSKIEKLLKAAEKETGEKPETQFGGGNGGGSGTDEMGAAPGVSPIAKLGQRLGANGGGSNGGEGGSGGDGGGSGSVNGGDSSGGGGGGGKGEKEPVSIIETKEKEVTIEVPPAGECCNPCAGGPRPPTAPCNSCPACKPVPPLLHSPQSCKPTDIVVNMGKGVRSLCRSKLTKGEKGGKESNFILSVNNKKTAMERKIGEKSSPSHKFLIKNYFSREHKRRAEDLDVDKKGPNSAEIKYSTEPKYVEKSSKLPSHRKFAINYNNVGKVLLSSPNSEKIYSQRNVETTDSKDQSSDSSEIKSFEMNTEKKEKAQSSVSEKGVSLLSDSTGKASKQIKNEKPSPAKEANSSDIQNLSLEDPEKGSSKHSDPVKVVIKYTVDGKPIKLKSNNEDLKKTPNEHKAGDNRDLNVFISSEDKSGKSSETQAQDSSKPADKNQANVPNVHDSVKTKNLHHSGQNRDLDDKSSNNRLLKKLFSNKDKDKAIEKSHDSDTEQTGKDKDEKMISDTEKDQKLIADTEKDHKMFDDTEKDQKMITDTEKDQKLITDMEKDQNVVVKDIEKDKTVEFDSEKDKMNGGAPEPVANSQSLSPYPVISKKKPATPAPGPATLPTPSKDSLAQTGQVSVDVMDVKSGNVQKNVQKKPQQVSNQFHKSPLEKIISRYGVDDQDANIAKEDMLVEKLFPQNACTYMDSSRNCLDPSSQFSGISGAMGGGMGGGIGGGVVGGTVYNSCGGYTGLGSVMGSPIGPTCHQTQLPQMVPQNPTLISVGTGTESMGMAQAGYGPKMIGVIPSVGGHPHTWCAPCSPNTGCGSYTTHACGECCHTPVTSPMHPVPTHPQEMTHVVPVQTTPQMIPIEVKECPCPIEGKECPCEAKPEALPNKSPVQVEAKTEPPMQQIEAKPEQEPPPPCEAKEEPGCTPESVQEVLTSEGLKPGKTFKAKGKVDSKKWIVQNLLMKKVKVVKPTGVGKGMLMKKVKVEHESIAKKATKMTILKHKGASRRIRRSPIQQSNMTEQGTKRQMCSDGLDSCQGFNPVVRPYNEEHHNCAGCNDNGMGVGMPHFNQGAGGMMMPQNIRHTGSHVINVMQHHGPPLIAKEVEYTPMSGTPQPNSVDMGDNPYGLGGSLPGIDSHMSNYCVEPMKQPSYHGTMGVHSYHNEPCYHIGDETQSNSPLYPDLSVVPMPGAGAFEPQASCSEKNAPCTEGKGICTEGKGMFNTEGKECLSDEASNSGSNMGATINSIAANNDPLPVEGKEEPSEGKNEGGNFRLEGKGGSWTETEGKGCPCEGKEGCPCEEKGVYSEGKGFYSEGKGMESEGKGMGSEGKGMGTEGKGGAGQQEYIGQEEADGAAPNPDKRPPPDKQMSEGNKRRLMGNIYNFEKKSLLTKGRLRRTQKEKKH